MQLSLQARRCFSLVLTHSFNSAASLFAANSVVPPSVEKKIRGLNTVCACCKSRLKGASSSLGFFKPTNTLLGPDFTWIFGWLVLAFLAKLRPASASQGTAFDNLVSSAIAVADFGWPRPRCRKIKTMRVVPRTTKIKKSICKRYWCHICNTSVPWLMCINFCTRNLRYLM